MTVCKKMCLFTLAGVVAFGVLCGSAQAQGGKAHAKAEAKIQQTFREVLDRDASSNDIKHHIKLLEEGLKPMEMRKNIVLSDEGTRAIKSVFKEKLGREPNNKQLNKARAGLSEGQTLNDLRRALAK